MKKTSNIMELAGFDQSIKFVQDQPKNRIYDVTQVEPIVKYLSAHFDRAVIVTFSGDVHELVSGKAQKIASFPAFAKVVNEGEHTYGALLTRCHQMYEAQQQTLRSSRLAKLAKA